MLNFISVCPVCQHPAEVLCRRCRVPTPLPETATHFQVLGVLPRLDLDQAQLGDHMVARTQQVHPDRFQTRPPEERERALVWAAAINNAYRTLRDPVARAQYWLRQHGVALGESSDPVAPDLAARLFAAREALAEWQAAPEDAALRAAVDAARETAESDLTAALAGMRAIFRAHDAAESPSAAAIHLSDLRTAVGVVRALQKLCADLASALPA